MSRVRVGREKSERTSHEHANAHSYLHCTFTHTHKHTYARVADKLLDSPNKLSAISSEDASKDEVVIVNKPGAIFLHLFQFV